MEYLSFAKNGQWTLCKATNANDGTDKEPRSDYKPKSKEYKVYDGATLDGALHDDLGRKGQLNDFNGGVRPKGGRVNWKNVGKPSHPAASVHNQRNPGVGD
jgi:hypothetical protein